MSSKLYLSLSLIEKMERENLSAKSASCDHNGDNCLWIQTAVLCNADSWGDTLNMRHLQSTQTAFLAEIQKKYIL